MVYLWQLLSDDDDSSIGEYQRELSPDRFEFQAGKRLPDSFGTAVVRFDSTLARILSRDCLASSAMVPIVNEKCRRILESSANGDAQFFPCRVIASDGEADGFSLVNATVKRDCVDKSRSAFDCIPGTEAILRFSRLELVDGCLGDHGLARLGEYPPLLLVSDELAATLLDSGLRGIHLATPDEACS